MTTEMKLYAFECDTYAEWWVVMSDTAEHALAAVKRHQGPDEYFAKWRDATVESLPEGYTLNVYGKDHVVEAEWA